MTPPTTAGAADDRENDSDTAGDDTADSAVAPLLAVYRHDVHKLRGRAHDAAADSVAGVPVNEPVPEGADADAARLSRPDTVPEQTVENHATPHRLSLRTGETVVEERLAGTDPTARLHELVRIDDPEQAHRAWLAADLPAAYNESVYYPYTSLKYHVLLTAALLAAYRDGAGFSDLRLAVDPPDASITPHRTVFATDRVALRLTPDPDGRPATGLGPTPARSFADVWARLPARPAGIDPDTHREWRVLDAQLRRIRAWSTALQYLEDVLQAGPASERASAGHADGEDV